MNQEEKFNAIWSAIPIGAGLGVALGVVLMKVMDHPGFFAVGIAFGLALGTAVAVMLEQRERDQGGS